MAPRSFIIPQPDYRPGDGALARRGLSCRQSSPKVPAPRPAPCPRLAGDEGAGWGLPPFWGGAGRGRGPLTVGREGGSKGAGCKRSAISVSPLAGGGAMTDRGTDNLASEHRRHQIKVTGNGPWCPLDPAIPNGWGASGGQTPEAAWQRAPPRASDRRMSGSTGEGRARHVSPPPAPPLRPRMEGAGRGWLRALDPVAVQPERWRVSAPARPHWGPSLTANGIGTVIDTDDVTAHGGVFSADGGKRFCLQKHSLIFLFTPPSSPP